MEAIARQMTNIEDIHQLCDDGIEIAKKDSNTKRSTNITAMAKNVLFLI